MWKDRTSILKWEKTEKSEKKDNKWGHGSWRRECTHQLLPSYFVWWLCASLDSKLETNGNTLLGYPTTSLSVLLSQSQAHFLSIQRIMIPFEKLQQREKIFQQFDTDG